MFVFGFGLWDTNVVTRNSRGANNCRDPPVKQQQGCQQQLGRQQARMPAEGGSPATGGKLTKLRKPATAGKPARSGTQSTARTPLAPTAGKNVGSSRVYSNIRHSRPHTMDVKSNRTPGPERTPATLGSWDAISGGRSGVCPVIETEHISYYAIFSKL
jgi:hypothetical protein